MLKYCCDDWECTHTIIHHKGGFTFGTDLRDSEKPCMPQKFCNVSVRVRHGLLSVYEFTNVKSL